LWLKAGAAGMLWLHHPPRKYGGIGADYLFDVVVFRRDGPVGFSPGPAF